MHPMFVVTYLLVVIGVFANTADSLFNRDLCANSCRGRNCPEPIGCIYGVEEDLCGAKVCAVGPGDRCGNFYGKCGLGLSCSCDGYCVGCSLLTMGCYEPASRNC